MSFSSDVKSELKEQLSDARHCRIAEFAAIFALSGHIKKDKEGNTYLEIHTENLTVAQKSYILLKCTFNADVEIDIRNHNLQGSTVNYYLIVSNEHDVINILKAVKVLDEQKKIRGDFSVIHRLVVQNTCCKRAFLRGAFMVAGSITNPEKTYHMEIAVLSEKFAGQLKEILAFFDIDAKIVERKKYSVVYVKEGSQIVDFLNVIGAHIALMNFENVRILKEVRNSVNRQVNCETANISKTVNAAAKQIEDIKYIECNMGFSHLSVGLREVAELRLDYPESSLQELGKMLEKPISKSGVNHRLRKLSEIANDLRDKEDMKS